MKKHTTHHSKKHHPKAHTGAHNPEAEDATSPDSETASTLDEGEEMSTSGDTKSTDVVKKLREDWDTIKRDAAREHRGELGVELVVSAIEKLMTGGDEEEESGDNPKSEESPENPET